MLNAKNVGAGYKNFKQVILRKIKISVEVSGVTALKLENDAGGLDPKKAFLPFGPQPAARSVFLVGCEEALAKKLERMEITVSLA